MNKQDSAVRTIEGMNGVSEMDIPRSTPTPAAEPSKNVSELRAQAEKHMASLREIKDELEAIDARRTLLLEGKLRTEGAVLSLNQLVQELSPETAQGARRG